MYGRQDATRDRCLDASGLLSGKDATLSDDLGRTPLPAAPPTDSVCLFMFQLFSPVRSPPRGEPGFFFAQALGTSSRKSSNRFGPSEVVKT